MYEKLSEKKSHGTSQLVEILFEGAILFLILIDHQFSEIVWKSAKLEHYARTTDTQWSHKSNISEKLGRCGRQNMLRPYLKIWDWDWIFGRAVKAISSLGVRSPCRVEWMKSLLRYLNRKYGDSPNYRPKPFLNASRNYDSLERLRESAWFVPLIWEIQLLG